jgi:hypothetical protein
MKGCADSFPVAARKFGSTRDIWRLDEPALSTKYPFLGGGQRGEQGKRKGPKVQRTGKWKSYFSDLFESNLELTVYSVI